ncbi:hypothetical protein PAPHI01_0052 [Pancytospora philotis]|nr:hypothetical protein PAPHI01_0052 [Pancytospora philotis]
MDVLVDVFYFDFVLSKIIQVYSGAGAKDELAAYCKIANVLHAKIVDMDIALDAEVYAKSITIRLLQLGSKGGDHLGSAMPGVLSYAMQVVEKYGVPISELLREVLLCVAACYVHYAAAELEARPEHRSFITQSLGVPDGQEILAQLKLAGPFELKSVLARCAALSYGEPVLYGFVSQTAANIENSENWGPARKYTVDVNTSSPGKKVVWD